MYWYFIILIILCFFGYTQKNKSLSNVKQSNVKQSNVKPELNQYIAREDNLLNE